MRQLNPGASLLALLYGERRHDLRTRELASQCLDLGKILGQGPNEYEQSKNDYEQSKNEYEQSKNEYEQSKNEYEQSKNEDEQAEKRS
ncbi:hypothetical protein WR25_26874 [Diploscapter pachys]|uniref:Uncharacterized protein n=1 Tax=Diploscapter pachys TaxID=2018661 RepID=A0A2A2K6P2_9BILA|nr:hypothetical protein WR25_26874 [Diploscapter pachys]